MYNAATLYSKLLIMLRVFLFAGFFLHSCLGLAHQTAPMYQIDMILFTHLQSALSSNDNATLTSIAPDLTHAIRLQNKTRDNKQPYQLLPSSTSQLRNEYWALNRKPQYQVLFHYTWLQPANNQRPIALTDTVGGWSVEGTLLIKQSNYYLLDSELLFSAPNSPQTAFIFSKKQRLKPGVVYYLDHPQAGMLIKVHQIT